MLQQVLTATCWFDPGERGHDQTGPGPVTISFSGRRSGLAGPPGPGDTFTQQETVRHVVPGSGPAAVTTQVRGINAGEWTVTAEPVGGAGPAAAGSCHPGPRRRPLLARWGAAPASAGRSTVSTTPPLAVRVPGTVRYGWAALMILGVLAGLGVEAAVLARARVPAGAPLGFSVLAIAAGLVGGKAWYIALRRDRQAGGWCIQGGLVAGVGAGTACLLLAGLSHPAGAYLDAAAPGLLTGMTVGRLGCLLAGCCAGRPTARRWGLWSSDGRVGLRRIPVQIFEALLALATGLAALVLVWRYGLGRDGYEFAGALAAYTLGRQFLLGLRAEPRRTRYGRPVTAAAAAAVLAAVILLAVAR